MMEKSKLLKIWYYQSNVTWLNAEAQNYLKVVMHTVSERYQICCVFFETVKYLVGLGLPQFDWWSYTLSKNS